jgi:uncharacterized OB-fold protein
VLDPHGDDPGQGSVNATTDTWDKPLPNIDADNEEFYEGLRRHELLLWTCRTCGARYWPKSYCVHHENEPWAANLEWQPSSGHGTLFAFNLHHWAFHPGFEAELPYAYALVELTEGPLISSTFVGELPAATDVGRPVQVVFEDHPDLGFTLPRFRFLDG